MAIGAALNNLGIPKDSVGNYDTALKSQSLSLWSTARQKRLLEPKALFERNVRVRLIKGRAQSLGLASRCCLSQEMAS